MSAPTRHPAEALRRSPAELLFVLGAISLYAGSSLAVLVFDEVDALGVAWLRGLGAAVVLSLWRRPWRRTWTARRVGLVAVFGIVTTGMNTAFYLSIDRIPVGTAVAIEFLGPVAVAAARTRSRRDVLALGLVVVGVLAVSGVRWEGAAVGIVWALTAATLWGGYIVFGHRVAGDGVGIDGLAVGLAIGAVVFAPVAAPSTAPVWTDARLLLVCLAVAVFSNVVPYGLDQITLRRLTAERFAMLLAILPVTATIVAAVVLGQVPRPLEAAGIAVVVVALAIRDRSADRTG
ncbi:MAG: EamA family transporter [Actinomycetota bacterium]